MLRHYNKQKSFRNGLSGATKYDEFELCWTRTQADDRTSRVYVGGLSDPSAEYCAIYGPYDDEDGVGGTNTPGVISLQALTNAQHQVPGSDQAGGSNWGLSEDDWIFNDMIDFKPPKFQTRFPSPENLYSQATFSSSFFYDHDLGLDEIYESGAQSNSSDCWLPADNHVNMLTGCCHLQAHVLARDDENILADGLMLNVTVWIEGWNSLTKNPKSKSRAKKYKSNYRRSRGSRYGR